VWKFRSYDKELDFNDEWPKIDDEVGVLGTGVLDAGCWVLGAGAGRWGHGAG
jgi:hypothetical protein